MIYRRALPSLETDRLVLKLLEPSQAELMVRFRVENRDFLAPWEPTRPREFFTRSFWDRQLHYLVQEYRQGMSFCLAIMDRDQTEVMGVCNYTSIIRGTFLVCQLGYSLGERHQGQGYMFEALSAANAYVFSELKLHRIMANYLPRNERSGRLLFRLGFRIEGLGREFLKINGVWEDHILTSLINPEL